LSFYNVLFTLLPPLVIGIFDQFVSARILDRYPQLYMLGQKNAFFTKTAFWLWIGNALYHSIVRIPFSSFTDRCIYSYSQVAFGFSVILFWGDLKSSKGYDCGHWFWGTMLYLVVLLIVLGKAALVSEYVYRCVTILSTLLIVLSQHMDEVYCCRYDTRQRRRSHAHLIFQRSPVHLCSPCFSFPSTSSLLPVSGSLWSIGD
jgi:magnesium-transporting ATPase (P-type)